MAGAGNSERQEAYALETVAGVINATPAFIKSPFDTLTLSAAARTEDARFISSGGQRSGISRNGFDVTGSAQSKLLYGTADDFLASLLQSNWVADEITNGTTQVSMSFEQSIPAGANGALQHTRFRGVQVLDATLSLEAGANAGLTFNFIGLGSDDATPTDIAGATYAEVANTNIIGSGSDIGVITMSGFDPLDCMRTLEINFAVDGKEDQPRIGSDDGCGITSGTLLPILTGQFYVEDTFTAIYNAARAGTEFALAIPIGQETGEKYLIEFPRCEFTLAPLTTAESGPAFQDYTILPLYDSVIGGTVKITRAIA